MHLLRLCVLCVLMTAVPALSGPIDGFERSNFANEQVRQWKISDARIVMNAPGDFDASKPTLLVIYATPNGNTIEQTMGCRLEKGMDWHFDIQHIAAQIRKLRQIDSKENVVIAYVEADKLSWGAWRTARPDNAKLIRAIVSELSRAVPGPVPRVALAAHSGGGSFIFGYLNGGETIGENISRIIWLDANYSYDEKEHHGAKLLAWLKSDPSRRLVVIAYDDSDVKLNGKPVLKNPMGGTFGSSKRMIEFFASQTKLEQESKPPFETASGMDGRLRFYVHANPEKKILHTVLVERNGLLHALTLGTAMEGKWGGEFWGNRAYAELIAPASTTRPATTKAAMVGAKSQAGSKIPPRPEGAVGGKAFIERIAKLPLKEREDAIAREVISGNIPDFLRHFRAILVNEGGKHEAIIEVMPDYLAVGSNEDFVRLPMTPATAASIADAFDCTLPTRKIVDDVYRRAEVKLEPKPMTERREAVESFAGHNAIIERQRGGKEPGLLVAGIKKDIVISNRLKEKPNRVAIYGWHQLNGKPIQPLTIVHGDQYVDYSHGVRLVRREMTMDGEPARFEQVITDPVKCGVLSDEGSIETAAGGG